MYAHVIAWWCIGYCHSDNADICIWFKEDLDDFTTFRSFRIFYSATCLKSEYCLRCDAVILLSVFAMQIRILENIRNVETEYWLGLLMRSRDTAYGHAVSHTEHRYRGRKHNIDMEYWNGRRIRSSDYGVIMRNNETEYEYGVMRQHADACTECCIRKTGREYWYRVLMRQTDQYQYQYP